MAKEKYLRHIIRLRGGAREDNVRPLTIFTQAIESAKKHGINLIPGKSNNADGNCAFESVIHNINFRDCYSEKLCLSPTTYRHVWMTDLEKQTINFPTLGAGFTAEERRENWNLLKQSGVYEIEFFGDMVLHGIAMGCHKNILIFNTNAEANYPIYVIEAKEFGGYTDSDIPVVLAYNQVHYESLHPISKIDIDKTKDLVNSFISGNYSLLGKDILHMISPPVIDNNKNKVKANISKKTKQDSTLEELKLIKKSQRTVAQEKEYRKLLKQEQRKNLSPAQKEKIKEQDRREHKISKSTKSMAEKSSRKEKNIKAKKISRSKKSTEEKLQIKI